MSYRCSYPTTNQILFSIVIGFCAGLGSNGDKKIKAASATPVAPVAKTPEKEQKTPKDKKGQPKTPTIEKVL